LPCSSAAQTAAPDALGVDIIKIDKMFVDAIGTDHNSTTIVETLIDLAHNMAMDVVAEGVENFEQVMHLCETGRALRARLRLRPAAAGGAAGRVDFSHRRRSLTPFPPPAKLIGINVPPMTAGDRGETEVRIMLRIIIVFVVFALLTAMPAPQAVAQDNVLGGALLGGAAGAIIGGAATGKAGGAVAGGVIGAAAGAVLGSQLEPRRGGYYWYHGRCYRRHRDGNYYPTRHDYCY
jgi:hypothetical protein